MAVARDVVAPRMAGAPRVGLIVSAVTTFPGEADTWRENGIKYEPECVQPGTVLDICEPGDKPDPDPLDVVEWDAYVLSVGVPCRSTYGYRRQDWTAKARRALIADEERQLSNELWSGDKSRADAESPNTFLASATSDTISDGPQTIVDSLACLEDYIASCNGGQQAMIHATSQVVAQWFAAGSLLRREASLILTNSRDTIVVGASGYDGSGPGTVADDVPVAASDGSTWAYATGIVEVRRGPIEVLGDPATNPEQVARSTNTMRVMAERVALASWDRCCHGAVEIDIGPCSIGGVS